MFNNATDRIRKIAALAKQNVSAFNTYSLVRDEHILLAILQEGGGCAVSILKNAGVDVYEIQASIAKYLKNANFRKEKDLNTIDFSQDTKNTFAKAHEIAKSHGQTYLGSEHLLLAIISNNDNYSCQLVWKYLDKIHQSFIDLCGPKTKASNSSSVLSTETISSTGTINAMVNGNKTHHSANLVSPCDIVITDENPLVLSKIIEHVNKELKKPWGPNEYFRQVNISIEDGWGEHASNIVKAYSMAGWDNVRESENFIIFRRKLEHKNI